MNVKINKWGNSLWLRLPKPLAAKNKFKEGTEIEFLASPEGILIRKKQKKVTLDMIIKSYPRHFKPGRDLIPENLESEQW